MQVLAIAMLLSLDAGAEDSAARLCRTAKSLAAAQADFGEKRATWEWQPGSGLVADNTAGIIAVALASSGAGCDATIALERYASERVRRHVSWEQLYDADVEALGLAAGLLSEPSYLEMAREAFDRRYGGASGEEIVERWFWVRRGEVGLIGFDAAQAIRAAVAVGRRGYAREISDAVLAAAARWGEGKDSNGVLSVSRGALLEALALLNAPPRYSAAAQDLVHHLVLAQASDGSFGEGNPQATAYAVRGLAAWGGEVASSAARLGQGWLRRTWLPGDTVHEVTAEVMLALR